MFKSLFQPVSYTALGLGVNGCKARRLPMVVPLASAATPSRKYPWGARQTPRPVPTRRAGFILLLGFAGLTLYNGKRIEATTQSLAQEKLPGLIAATELGTLAEDLRGQISQIRF